MSMHPAPPAAPVVPDLAGKVIFLTGGTNGIGKEALLSLAAHNPSEIYFSGRDDARGASVVKELEAISSGNTKVTFIPLDLLSLKNVKTSIEEILPGLNKLDVFVANAGIMGTPAHLTEDGYEEQWQTNHVAHSLIISLLLPTLSSTPESRIVSVTSLGALAPSEIGIDFDALKTTQDTVPGFGKWIRYCQSKLANIVYAKQLARHHPSVLSVAIHPGMVGTNLISSLPEDDQDFVMSNTGGRELWTPAEGAYNTVWAATATEGIENGAFYVPVGAQGPSSSWIESEELGERLYEWTNEELKRWL